MDGTFRIGTFNIHHGEGRDGRIDLERTAAVIRSLNADVIALQEVDRNLERSGGVDQVATLERLTGYQIAFHPALLRGQGEYGLGLATRAATPTVIESLPRRDREERRVVIQARWEGLSILATHLSRDEMGRHVQIEALATLASRMSPPVLVLGDFNERLSGLSVFTHRGYEPALSGLPLIRTLRRRVQIDHILAGPGLSIRSVKRTRTFASDHAALVATVARRGDVPRPTR